MHCTYMDVWVHSFVLFFTFHFVGRAGRCMHPSRAYGGQRPTLRSQSSPSTMRISGTKFRSSSFSEKVPFPQKPPQWTEYVHLCRVSTLTQQSVWKGENRKHLGNRRNVPRGKLHSWPHVLGPRQDIGMLKELYKITLWIGRWFKE